MLNILLPTDFSKNAFHAISYCVELYKNTTCAFYLMHSYTPAIYRAEYMIGSPGQIGLGDEYQQVAQNKLEKIKKKLETKFNNPRHTFIIHAAFNDLVDEVGHVAQHENIDLIAMGTQGATGAKEILLESNTVHIIKKAKVPVLAIPTKMKFKALRTILFPTDFEIYYDLVDLKYLLGLAKLHDAAIHIMYVSTPQGLSEEQKKNKKDLENIMQSSKHYFYDLPDQELIGAINSFQSEHDVQLLTMVRNKHTFLERLFIDPIIKKIGFHTSIPFLVFPYRPESL